MQVPLGLLLCEFVTCAALGVTNFTLHIVGLVGAILGPQAASTPFSLTQLASEVLVISSEASPAILAALQLIYIVTCLALPLLWVVLVLVVWLVPLRPPKLRALLVVAETVYAWAMLDVLLVVICASLLELDQVAKFTLGDECAGIDRMLQQYDELGSLLPGEASCFGVQPTLDSGFWLCLGASIGANLCGGFVMCAAHVALEEHGARVKAAL